MADKKTYAIYLIVSPELKMYVGMTHDINQRFGKYKGLARKNKNTSQRLLTESLALYDWDDHDTSILRSAIPTKAEAFVWERYYIHKLSTFLTDHGLNLTRGGDGVDNWTADRREEQRDRMRTLTEDGENPLHSKMSKNKALAACRTEEYRANHSEIMAAIYADKDGTYNDTPVKQMTLEGYVVDTFKSFKKAADATGSRATKISDCVNGRRKTHNGYLWERA